MARPRPQNTEGFGSDSFLDIVCNMVGIIILLVLVVGLRIKDAPLTMAAEVTPAEPAVDSAVPPAGLRELEAGVRQQQAALAAANAAGRTLEGQLHAARQAAAQQERTNHDAQQFVIQRQQSQSQLQAALLARQQQLEALRRAVQFVPDAPPAKMVRVEAYPAPVSKTVDDDEAHFQILGDRVVHVPFAALVDRFKADARNKVQASPSSTQIEAVVGPIGDFNLRYVLNQVGHGRFALERFSFIPASNRLGETAAEARAPSSQFRRVLASYDPNRTTITFWTYQDSFETFRQLRKEVYLLGYSVASRPLPIGQLISGSPDGTRSAAQ